MKIINHPLCTTTIGAPADMQDGSCDALPVLYTADTHGLWAVSFWMPDAAELAMLNAGGGINLYVRAVGRQHPVVGLGTYPADVPSTPPVSAAAYKAVRDDLRGTVVTLASTQRQLAGARAALGALAARPGAPADHQVRELVNELRDIALKFHAAGQLRARISDAVLTFLAAKPITNASTETLAIAEMHTSTGMRCTYCCAKAGDQHAAGCPELPGGSIEQWSTGQRLPQCPICHDTGTAFGKVCTCGGPQ
jgi:hypothetical protein